jgi:3-phosphoglycerate kinase
LTIFRDLTCGHDNGTGMAPNVLKVAMAFGGSMNFGNRDTIAQFGMGMKTAGGAFLEWTEGKSLPGVEVLRVA